jgi:phosphoketolase
MDHPAPTLPSADQAGDHEVADSKGTLTYDELMRTNAYWRAANYLSVGQSG